MQDNDPFKEKKLKKLQLLMYLVPVVGCLPAFWTLYRHQGNDEQQAVSRLSVRLTLIWFLAYTCLWIGASQTSELLTLRLLYLNSLLTSGYFLVCLAAMVRLLQGKSLSSFSVLVGAKRKAKS